MARITEKIRVRINHCEPVNPFYLRWRNNLGGTDHWLFDKRQDYSLNTASSGPYEPFSDDLSAQRAKVRYIDHSGRERAQIYAEQLTDAEVEGMKSLMLSQRVEYLQNLTTGVWVEIKIVPGTFATRRTDSTLHDISMTVEFQPINVPSN